jgi:hypothetical protein
METGVRRPPHTRGLRRTDTPCGSQPAPVVGELNTGVEPEEADQTPRSREMDASAGGGGPGRHPHPRGACTEPHTLRDNPR